MKVIPVRQSREFVYYAASCVLNLLADMLYVTCFRRRRTYLFNTVFRYQISEVSFVLKAIATLVQSLRKAPPDKGNLKNLAFTIFFIERKRNFHFFPVFFCIFKILLLIQIVMKIYDFKTLVGHSAWQQLISLYPCLVDCVTTSSPDITVALRDALLQYATLLQTPKT